MQFICLFCNIKVGRGLAPAGQLISEIAIAAGNNMCYFSSENPEIRIISGGGTKAPPYNSIIHLPDKFQIVMQLIMYNL